MFGGGDDPLNRGRGVKVYSKFDCMCRTEVALLAPSFHRFSARPIRFRKDKSTANRKHARLILPAAAPQVPPGFSIELATIQSQSG